MEAILPLLAATRSPSRDGRAAAETQLAAQCARDPAAFADALLDCAESARDRADQQSALFVLKSAVARRWNDDEVELDEPAAPAEYAEQAQAAHVAARARPRLLRLLETATSARVRAAAAVALQAVAALQYPAQWPELPAQTLALLDAPHGSPALTGALVLLLELVRDVFSEQDFAQIGWRALERLYAIASAPVSGATDVEQRNLAVQAFKEASTFFLMADAADAQAADMAERSIPQFVRLFVELAGDVDRAETVIETAAALRELDSGFQSLLAPLLPELYVTVLTTLRSQFAAIAADEDLMRSYCYLLELCIQSPAVRAALGDAEARELVGVLVALARLPEELYEELSEDLNAFVSAEMELDVDDTGPRSYAGVMVAGTRSAAVLPALVATLEREGRGAASEPVLFLVASLLQQIDAPRALAGLSRAQTQTLLAALEYAPGDAALLTARKGVTAAHVARYARQLPAEMRATLARHALAAPPPPSAVVAAAQLRAAALAEPAQRQAFAGAEEQLFALLVALIAPARDDTPLFLTESLRTLLQLPGLRARVASTRVLDVLFALAQKNTADNDLISEVLDVVSDFLDAYGSSADPNYILVRVAATVESAAPGQFAYSSDLCFALELAAAVFKHAAHSLAPSDAERMLDSFYTVLTTTEDPQVFQVATSAHLALFTEYKTQVSRAAAAKALQVAQRLLAPGLDESLAVACGEYFVSVCDALGADAGETLLPMVAAAAERLTTATNALLVEALALLFSELVLRDAAAVVAILSERALLTPVMRKWLPAFEVVRGSDEIEKNVRALQALVDLDSAELNAVLVDDEPVWPSGRRVLTRRQARGLQFTQTTLPLKIVKLLVRELAQTPQLTGTAAVRAGDSDDEWVDEVEVDADGLVNYNTFNIIVEWFQRLYKEGRVEWLAQLSAHDRKVLMDASSIAAGGARS